jgi:hypothetical protein
MLFAELFILTFFTMEKVISYSIFEITKYSFSFLSFIVKVIVAGVMIFTNMICKYYCFFSKLDNNTICSLRSFI